MATNNDNQASGSKPSEFSVVVNRASNKKISVVQFQGGTNVDLVKAGLVQMQRENNLKEFKNAYNIDSTPKFGEGSEFGKEAKDEARRRKFGYVRRNYNPEAQPWLMRIGADKTAKKFKGTRNGGILQNAAYFIFSRRPDGVFEALPVEEWYNFKPTISYNNLNAEEAEEEFAKRDKNLNLFSIMVRKRLKQEADEPEEADSKANIKKSIKKSGLMLTEMEDWADLSDENSDAAEAGSDEEKGGKGKAAKGKTKGKKKKEKDSDDEAIEDSDDGDEEGKQVDYMSDTSNSDSDAEGRANKSKYEEKGVEDEDGLKNIVPESSESEEEKPEENESKKSENGSSESNSSESESDDPDKEENEFTKVFLMQGPKKERGRSPAPATSGSVAPGNEDKKRKAENGLLTAPSPKKIKQEPTDRAADKTIPSTYSQQRPATPSGLPGLVASAVAGVLQTGTPTPPMATVAALSKEGLTEEAVKRYLMRKPMSSKDLYKMFKSKKLGMTNEELVTNIANILKRLRTTQMKINGVIHFSISDK